MLGSIQVHIAAELRQIRRMLNPKPAAQIILNRHSFHITLVRECVGIALRSPVSKIAVPIVAITTLTTTKVKNFNARGISVESYINSQLAKGLERRLIIATYART